MPGGVMAVGVVPVGVVPVGVVPVGVMRVGMMPGGALTNERREPRARGRGAAAGGSKKGAAVGRPDGGQQSPIRGCVDAAGLPASSAVGQKGCRAPARPAAQAEGIERGRNTELDLACTERTAWGDPPGGLHVDDEGIRLARTLQLMQGDEECRAVICAPAYVPRHMYPAYVPRHMYSGLRSECAVTDNRRNKCRPGRTIVSSVLNANA